MELKQPLIRLLIMKEMHRIAVKGFESLEKEEKR